jgi:hypothetical protein
MSNSSFDTNISNYSLAELMTIVQLDNLDPKEIVKVTNKYISKFKNSDPGLSIFFKQMQSQLLQYSMKLIDKDTDNLGYEDEDEDENDNNVEGFEMMDNEATFPLGEKQTSNWIENQALKQDNTSQTNKITERKQKIDVYANTHVPMKREQLGVNNTFQLPVAQDSLNPNLKNTITRFINLDSQFRQYSNTSENSSTDFSLDLSDTLKDALSISLYSYQIPYSWYTIDTAYGNTCLWISDGSYNISIYALSGNYSPSNFVTMMNRAFANAGFVFSDINPGYPYPDTILAANLPVYYDSNSGKITLFLAGGEYKPSGTTLFTISESTIITFFDFTGVLQCATNCVNKSRYLNQTLGWLMGYRMPFIYVDSSGNVAPSVLDLNGTKYLILVLDDYNQNHVNNGLVSITELSNILKMPNYYSPDLPYTCLSPEQQQSNLQLLIAGATYESIINGQPSSDNGLLIAGKYENDYTSTQLFLPSAPRTLTQSQLYTINEINRNKNNNTNYRAKAPTNSDILAIIPVKHSGASTGNLLVEFSGSLQDNKRVYFGPVNIERMNIKLINDKGNVINLNGLDWCVTIICECLYQY